MQKNPLKIFFRYNFPPNFLKKCCNFCYYSTKSNTRSSCFQKTATIKDIGNVVETYSPGAKTETLVLHAGHYSIDKGLSGQDAAMQMKDTVDKCMKKLKPHRVAVCKISPVKDGCYGRNSNNEAITNFNKQLEMICLEVDGLYPWSKVECLDNALTDNDISYDGVHPNINGIKNLANNIRHYNVLNNLPAAQNVIQTLKDMRICFLILVVLLC